ncbi:hypothetical protein [Longimicrobium sp.]|uniref:hypothetical protein n=1 Tax=Longimicrobium sp. TaxID=2029185 RepID=UPI002E36645D|nr:hypothetical protein [Longimicrobium sp.]HEX6039074.1 hypothetical protein [Longimicrobium sp.]
MYVLCTHAVREPREFWERATQALPNLPEGIRVHTVYPNADGTRGVFLWEGESVEHVRAFVDGATRDVSDNDYFAVRAEDARGLPA